MVDGTKPAEAAAAANATEEEKTVVDVVEQSPTLEETFEEPCLEDLKFKNSWTLWEHYDHTMGDMDYASSMCKTCWFNDLISFSIAWNTIPHRDLTNIFFNDQTRTIKL